MPTHQPISLLVGLLRGSKASLKWKFDPANITISSTYNNGLYDVKVHDLNDGRQFENYFDPIEK